MLRLGRLTDYAIVLAVTLAERGGESATARSLARETGIPWPTVVKLLKTLTGKNVLRSTLGRGGGYRLARPPAEIDLAEIIEAVEGRIALTECTRGPGLCSIEDSCPAQRHWPAINHAVHLALRGVRLSHLAKPVLTARDSGKLVPAQPD